MVELHPAAVAEIRADYRTSLAVLAEIIPNVSATDRDIALADVAERHGLTIEEARAAIAPPVPQTSAWQVEG